MATVLVVDDDEAIRESLELMLSEEGYEVIAACDGGSALSIMRHITKPLVALLDIMMPGCDGISVLSAVHKEPALQRHEIIVLTALNRVLPEALSRQLRSSEIPIMHKPFERDLLLAAIADVAEHQELLALA